MSPADDLAEKLDEAATATTVKAGAKAGAKTAKAGAKPTASATPAKAAKSAAKPPTPTKATKSATPAKAAKSRTKAAPSGPKSAKAGARPAAQPVAKSAPKPQARSGAPAKARARPKPAAAAVAPAEARAAIMVDSQLRVSVAQPTTTADTWDAAAREALRWTSTVMAIVPAFLLIFNAASLKNWADQLAPSPTTVTLQHAADGWEATTRRIGLSAPRDALHNAWNRAVALKWDGTSGDGADPG